MFSGEISEDIIELFVWGSQKTRNHTTSTTKTRADAVSATKEDSVRDAGKKGLVYNNSKKNSQPIKKKKNSWTAIINVNGGVTGDKSILQPSGFCLQQQQVMDCVSACMYVWDDDDDLTFNLAYFSEILAVMMRSHNRLWQKGISMGETSTRYKIARAAIIA